METFKYKPQSIDSSFLENQPPQNIKNTLIEGETEVPSGSLQYFEAVKIGIKQILDEKIIAKEKVGKASKARESNSKKRTVNLITDKPMKFEGAPQFNPEKKITRTLAGANGNFC